MLYTAAAQGVPSSKHGSTSGCCVETAYQALCCSCWKDAAGEASVAECLLPTVLHVLLPQVGNTGGSAAASAPAAAAASPVLAFTFGPPAQSAASAPSASGGGSTSIFGLPPQQEVRLPGCVHLYVCVVNMQFSCNGQCAVAAVPLSLPLCWAAAAHSMLMGAALLIVFHSQCCTWPFMAQGASMGQAHGGGSPPTAAAPAPAPAPISIFGAPAPAPAPGSFFGAPAPAPPPGPPFGAPASEPPGGGPPGGSPFGPPLGSGAGVPSAAEGGVGFGFGLAVQQQVSTLIVYLTVSKHMWSSMTLGQACGCMHLALPNTMPQPPPPPLCHVLQTRALCC
jgi:hypothetical protein